MVCLFYLLIALSLLLYARLRARKTDGHFFKLNLKKIFFFYETKKHKRQEKRENNYIYQFSPPIDRSTACPLSLSKSKSK
jgi:hypothetical protein